MSERGSWDSIREHGLLSTSALLDLFEIEDEERIEIESRLRMRSFKIRHNVRGVAVVRDQNAMWDKPASHGYPARMLEDCLDGISIDEWCYFLNQWVFFWPEVWRLDLMLNSPLYKTRPHWVIIVDTQLLIDHHPDRIYFSSINSGSIWRPDKRNKDSLKPLGEFNGNQVVELAVEHSVPNLDQITLAVEEWQGKSKIKTIWKPQ